MLAALTIVFVIITGTTSQPCQYYNSVELTHRSYNGVKYKDGEYYVNTTTQTERGCVCMKKSCARKCCPREQAFYMANKSCVPEPQQLDIPVHSNDNQQSIPGFNATENFHFLYGLIECSKANKEERFTWQRYASSKFHLRTDGKLCVETPGGTPNIIIYDIDKYCIDTFITDLKEAPYLNALICLVHKPENHNIALYSSCMLISCFFILLTVVVYAWLPELLNLHRMVLTAYLLCLFVAYILLGTMQILILKKNITQDQCAVLAFIIYFSLLSAIFWLNIMCYDIWWTFSRYRAHGRSESSHKRLSYYAIYAFGVPTVLTSILAALEFLYLPIQHPLLPKLRLQGSFLRGNSKLLYLYVPILILCVANMIFIGLTAFKIWKIKKETRILRGRESSTHNQDKEETQRFTLYVKLFTIMGINWILEVVSSFYPDAHCFWLFADAYNVLIGFIIFVIFVCKKKTWKKIKERFKQLKGDPLSRTQTTTSSTTRQIQSISRDELRLNSMKN